MPGQRDGAACRQVVQQVHDRTGGRTDLLLTSDEHAPYETAIREVYGIEQPRPRRPGPGRPPKPVKVLPPDLCYATVRKRREQGRVVEVVRTLVFGTLAWLHALLGRSPVSTTINTAFVERHNGTDRHQNSRKHRKTYGFSKELALNRAASFFIGYGYNFCWVVRTLRVGGKESYGDRPLLLGHPVAMLLVPAIWSGGEVDPISWTARDAILIHKPADAFRFIWTLRPFGM